MLLYPDPTVWIRIVTACLLYLLAYTDLVEGLCIMKCTVPLLRVVAEEELRSARCKQFNQLGHKIRQRLQAMQSLLADSRMKTITEEDAT